MITHPQQTEFREPFGVSYKVAVTELLEQTKEKGSETTVTGGEEV
jgi:hypothetical protein